LNKVPTLKKKKKRNKKGITIIPTLKTKIKELKEYISYSLVTAMTATARSSIL